jgi:hypothetical protein
MKRMKKIVLLAVLISTIAFGNDIQIPENVSSAFTKEFPGVANVNWKMEFDKYQAEFTQKNKTMTALFNTRGECIETATYIHQNELPDKTLEEIDWYYKNAQIISSRKAKNIQSNCYYRVIVETEEAFYFLKVDEEGDIIDTSVRYLSENAGRK